MWNNGVEFPEYRAWVWYYSEDQVYLFESLFLFLRPTNTNGSDITQMGQIWQSSTKSGDMLDTIPSKVCLPMTHSDNFLHYSLEYNIETI